MSASKIQFLTIVTAVMAAFAGYHAMQSSQQADVHAAIHDKFVTWMRIHKKSYRSPAEFANRLATFKKNISYIREMNKEHTSFKMGLNKFSDLSQEEFEAKFLGYRPSSTMNAKPAKAQAKVGANPPSVDHRKTGGIGPIKNQGNCGSCWAFSTVASMEFLHYQSTKEQLSLSEQQLVDCATQDPYKNFGCDGGLPELAFQYTEQFGLELEDSYKYTASNDQCKYDKSQVKATNTGFDQVPSMDGQALEDAAVERVVSVGVYASLWSFYQGGVFDSRFCVMQMNHAVNVVGYGTDSDSGKDYWIIRNSWGTDWGEDGYIRLAKDTGKVRGMCGVNLDPSYPTSN